MTEHFFDNLESRLLFSVAVPTPSASGFDTSLPAIHASAAVAAAAPTAKLAAKAVTASAASYKFTVTYASPANVLASSIATGNIQVTGPGGYSVKATLVSIAPAGNAKSIVATYSIAPTSGTFGSTNNGTYTVTLLANSVKTVKNGTNAKAAALGTFKLNIPKSTGSLPNLLGTYNGTTVVPNVSPTRGVQLTISKEDASGNFSGQWVTDAGSVFRFTGKVTANGKFTYSFTSDANHATGVVTGSGSGTGGGTKSLSFSFTATSGGMSAPGTMQVTKA